MSEKRVLWLFNHRTLMKSEVPILKELGYEIFIPKICPFDVSIAVDWNEDKHLTIPEDKLEILNKTDFYNSRIPKFVMEIMNEYFDIVIFGVFPEPFKSLVLYFKGKLVFHPFGISNDSSYSQIILTYCGDWLMRRLEGVGNRFWFAQSYENLSEVECDYFKSRAIYLPIGMRDTNIEDRWNGEKNKILFICPRIKTNTYYNGIYEQFKKDFNGFKYSIGGIQLINVNEDANVVGYLSDGEYQNFYPSHSCMFYHSQEKRHIHYHPFEAIKCGLPVIFMAGGLLDSLGGKDLPGRCKTIKEARRKCNRIIKGDIKFANRVRESQRILLDAMSYERCSNIWKSNMRIIEFNQDTSYISREKVLAIILPEAYQGGLFDYTINLLKIIRNGCKKNNERIKVVFGYPKSLNSEFYDTLKGLEDEVISLRPFEWETWSHEYVSRYSKLIGQKLALYNDEYSIMNDGISYFDDCDYLLFMVDRIRKNPFIAKQYGVIIHDYVQRYVPELFGDYYEKSNIDLVRNSQANFTTTQITLDNCVQYAGVRNEYMHLLPLFFNDINVDGIKKEVRKYRQRYFLWSTNISCHKNHILLLKALKLYYAMGGTWDCVITGVMTELLDIGVSLLDYDLIEVQELYLNKCRDIISKSKCLKEHLHFEGNLFKKEYHTCLSNAEFLIHPGYGDNGNGSAVDAALLGVPTLSSDYPAMRNMDQKMGLGITFFDKNSPEELAKLLLDVEICNVNLRKNMSKQEDLIRYTLSNEELCDDIYNIIRNNIDI